jgi:lipopolysaccharide transport system permease protein/teichoic acid transport system permease protein
MSLRELKMQFTGSLFGALWLFIHPLMMLVIYWVVFDLGFHAAPPKGVPFFLWLAAGLAVWNAFSFILSESLASIRANAGLIKRTAFQAHILPVIKILVAAATHAVFLLLVLGFILVGGLPLLASLVQLLYYFFCLAVFSLGMAWLLSALNVFLRDVGQVVMLMLQIGLWVTPILWDTSILPENLHIFVLLNPLSYVVQGYRDSFFYAVPFWEHAGATLYFWSFALVQLAAGAFVFKRLKPRFADVL